MPDGPQQETDEEIARRIAFFLRLGLWSEARSAMNNVINSRYDNRLQRLFTLVQKLIALQEDSTGPRTTI